MPPRKRTTTAPPPLTDTDVAEMRARVGAGDKPRVVVRTASAAVPAGTRGNVVRIGNPDEGEFIVVRLGRDEVPFAPNELAVATRGRPPAAAGKATATERSRPQRTRTARAEKFAEKPAAKTSKSGAAARTASRTSRRTTKAATAAATPTVKPTRTARTARTSSKRRAGQTLTVTLRFTDDVWTVEAQRGSRRIAKPSQVRPGAVKAFADLVQDPDVRAAMSETVASSRAVVEERAKKLRAELQAAEAALRDYEARHR